MVKKAIYGLIIGLLSAAAAVFMWRYGLLERFEAKTWDWRVQKLSKPGKFTDSIRLIYIDQASLDWVNSEMAYRWPWPRSLYQPILAYCKRQGAKVVAFDLLFTEPSSYGVEDDFTFISAITNSSPFVAALFLGSDSGSATNWPANVPSFRLETSGLEDWLKGLGPKAHIVLPKASFPIPELTTNAALLGNVAARPDADAIYRRMKPFVIFDGRAVPALGIAACLAGSTNQSVFFSKGFVRIGGRQIKLDRRGAAILNFRGTAGTHKRISAAAVIQTELKLQEGKNPPAKDMPGLKNCYVLVGCNAPGLLDYRPTPVGRIYTGAEIHATMLDNLLAGDFMRDVPAGLAGVLAFGLAIFWGIVILIGRSARDNIAAILLALPLPAGLCVLAYLRGYWMPFMLPETATALALSSAVLLNYATEGRQKRFIRGAFKQYLSGAVIEELVKHPERLTLGGEQRTLSIFFSDLQGFTGISEGLNPQELTSLLNEYLSAMTDIIQEEGGTVDKYEGDAIIAFWNAPLPQEDHAVRAVRAALRCQAQLAKMRPELRRRVGRELFMRIGLNTGPVVVGNMGSYNRFNYTILGDAANLASRLEGVNKQFGTYTIVSETTFKSMGREFAARELGLVAVVGRKTPVRIFEPMPHEEWNERRLVLEQFSLALNDFYAGRFSEALSKFEKTQNNEKASAAYAARCRQLMAAPPPKWEGVWVAGEK